MRLKHLMAVIVLLLCVGILFHLLQDRNPAKPVAGMAFETGSQLYAVMKSQGYLEMGGFAPRWPARVESVQESKDGITFAVPGNSPHVYSDPAYVGYRFMAVTLATTDDKHRFVMLYKTKDKLFDVE